MITALTVAVSYLLGSIPVAYIFGKLVAGIDIRRHGSGNVGAMNMKETLGWKAGIGVMVLDASKGAAAVALAVVLGGPLFLAAAAAVMGHLYPVWLRFEGGKGLSTVAGAVIAGAVFDQSVLLTALLVFAIIWFLFYSYFRDIDPASLTAALGASAVCAFYESVFWWLLPWLVVVFKHIQVLISGKHRSNT